MQGLGFGIDVWLLADGLCGVRERASCSRFRPGCLGR